MCLEYPSHCKDVVSKKVQNPSSNFIYSLFNFAISYSGFCNGFLLTFTYWFIDGLSGSAVMMGLTTAGRAVVNILIDIVLVKVIGFTGHQIVVNIVLVCHIITFVIYWSMKWPFLVILAEIFHATAHITIIQTCASFLSKNTPTGSSPKMQAILQGVYWGLGTGCGSIFGGYYLEYSGFKKTFLVFAVITSMVCIVFLFLQILLFLIKPEVTVDDMWSVWSSNSNYTSEYEGSSEESDDY
ncbi:major facilitator superfamily domain-containing protein 6-B-like [Xenia sp. Carnegie-2017]|uniref:major facilitator superfamily domain-containing protein 6-B-like n=1 Tax=Xenia sp. Carnegie-2017 TaxID=2897299 RepID=UPI001F036A0A|nr:major facilitator superfamily domain-containing protein 6-B-like [Xenia sp. Carnegie-2017]